jgi:hypothetical protein
MREFLEQSAHQAPAPDLFDAIQAMFASRRSASARPSPSGFDHKLASARETPVERCSWSVAES